MRCNLLRTRLVDMVNLPSRIKGVLIKFSAARRVTYNLDPPNQQILKKIFFSEIINPRTVKVRKNGPKRRLMVPKLSESVG